MINIIINSDVSHETDVLDLNVLLISGIII